MALDDPATPRILAFLEEIGIPVETGTIAGSFLPAIEIRNGGLIYDPAKLQWPGDLLHEAGHIAVTAPAARATLCEVRSDGGEEMCAIAWSYAALLAIGLEPTVVFHEAGYRGGSASLIENFANGYYLAVPLLQWYGMAFDEKAAAERGVAPYPAMQCWLRTRELE